MHDFTPVVFFVQCYSNTIRQQTTPSVCDCTVLRMSTFIYNVTSKTVRFHECRKVQTAAVRTVTAAMQPYNVQLLTVMAVCQYIVHSCVCIYIYICINMVARIYTTVRFWHQRVKTPQVLSFFKLAISSRDDEKFATPFFISQLFAMSHSDMLWR